ncbi:BZ3500_MvSof-1268-A1-R1_Chr4-2g07215 [Microbotryum saponariae]|uniref:BZ3500_MvSof-1268-A1-R1_Chr4-2g07215 protein n=1 Tax=Microbotryum saponariae TaxID=289078 RepID=A0A2X0LND9_9BASI|nr:BZ3500_MvSof-1268-A1-R1_Chr4-2g07215 [Microbotryum saponariae]SDA06880.1 BZ3501_MvSof-1269-A2-R1_Chr4-2g06926 [Microbotryum saponariae]
MIVFLTSCEERTIVHVLPMIGRKWNARPESVWYTEETVRKRCRMNADSMSSLERSLIEFWVRAQGWRLRRVVDEDHPAGASAELE